MIYLFHNILYNIQYETVISMSSLSKRISGLSKSEKRKICFLFKRMQIHLEQNLKRILGRQKNAFLQKTKQENKFRSKPKLEGWKKIRQGWLCFSDVQRTSKQGYRWVCKGTQINYGRITWQIFTSRGGSSSYKWN